MGGIRLITRFWASTTPRAASAALDQKLLNLRLRAAPFIPANVFRLEPDAVETTVITPPAIVAEYELSGLPITGQIAKGVALVIKEDLDISKYPLVDLAAEAAQRNLPFGDLLGEKIRLTIEAFETLEAGLKKTDGDFAQTLLKALMEVKTNIVEIMGQERIGAREAVERFLQNFQALKDSEDEHYRSIYSDYYLLCAKMLAKKHQGAVDIIEEVDRLGNDAIIVAVDISPSDVGIVNDLKVRGIVREAGSLKDHLSLRTGEREKAGLVGVEGVASRVKTGDRVIIDGKAGKLIVNPSTETCSRYLSLIEQREEMLAPLKALRHLAAVTTDGQIVELLGNVADAEEVHLLLKHGMQGVGLVRTEFFFINNPDNSPREEQPGIAEQIKFYNHIINAAQGKKVVIRTIDPDKDKNLPYFDKLNGLTTGTHKRGLELFLDKDSPYYFLFREQLMALLQTAGAVRVMFPLVRSKEEFYAVMALIDEVRAELANDGKRINDHISYGIMVEHPDILPDLPELAHDRRIAFFSLGTNDLTQYITQIDRYNSIASRYSDELDPRILEAIETTVKAAGEGGKELSLCGNMGNDWVKLLVLLGLGLRKISFSTGFVDVARKIIMSVSADELQVMVENIKKITTAKEIRHYVEEYTREKINSGAWAGLKEIEALLFE
jgi:phosphotransferase system enzyme I (PtsI)